MSVTPRHVVVRRTVAAAAGFGAASLSLGVALASPALAAGTGYGPAPPPPGAHPGVGHIAFTCTFGKAPCEGRVNSYFLRVTPTSTPPPGTQLPVFQQTGAHDPGHNVLVAFDLDFVQNGHQETGFPATVTISGRFTPGDSIVEFGPSGWTPVSATISDGTATFSITGSGVFAVVGPQLGS